MLIARLMILLILSHFSDQLNSNYTSISSFIPIGTNVTEQFSESDLNICNVIILMTTQFKSFFHFYIYFSKLKVTLKVEGGN